MGQRSAWERPERSLRGWIAQENSGRGFQARALGLDESEGAPEVFLLHAIHLACPWFGGGAGPLVRQKGNRVPRPEPAGFQSCVTHVGLCSTPPCALDAGSLAEGEKPAGGLGLDPFIARRPTPNLSLNPLENLINPGPIDALEQTTEGRLAGCRIDPIGLDLVEVAPVHGSRRGSRPVRRMRSTPGP